MNNKFFNDIVKGCYGRKIAYTNVDHIDESNVVKVLGDCIGTFNYNKAAISYLWNYFKGDQPALYRTKTVRDDVNNKVVENHAYEIVMFKTGQTYGEPIQLVSLKDNQTINKAVDTFNNYTRAINKPVKDIETGTWQSAVGTAYKGVQITGDKTLPFRLVNLNPLNTFVIYSKQTDEPMAGVEELYDADNRLYYMVYTATHEFRIQNSKLLLVQDTNGKLVKSKVHAFEGIPIIEYPNNSQRISDIELVITMLDAINNMQSNRSDAIEQFVQSWLKFINCEVDETSLAKMKEMGAIQVNSNGDNKKVDVEIMSQELKQSESQVAKDDLWDNVLSISAIPSTQQGSDGGSTQGAVELRSGWDFSKQRAKLKDPIVIESERKVVEIALHIIKICGNDDCKLTPFDYDVQINHSPTDNMLAKVQALNLLLQSGISPLVAISTVGLFEDAQKIYSLSKPYLDVKYQTIDEMVDETIQKDPKLVDEKKKAEKLLEGNKNVNNNEK